MSVPLTVLDHLEPRLLEAPAHALHRYLPGPTLLHLPGEREPPLFVSVLLHGNEDVGWEAVRRLLAGYGGGALPRSMALFIGNVAAAAARRRYLPGQLDYNRAWRPGPRPEQRLCAEVVARMRARGVFASVDLHNNTGHNPHYGCVNRLEPAYLRLARLFAPVAVYFRQPDTVQSMAFAGLCPAITVECGAVGERDGVDHALGFLRHVLALTDLDALPDAEPYLYHTVARLMLRAELPVAVGHGDAALLLDPAMEQWNFAPLPVGHRFARLGPGRDDAPPLRVWDERGADAFARYFAVEGDALVLRRPAVPSMLTVSLDAARADCLGYLMEPWAAP